MANKLALGLVIGGAVSATVGAAFKDVGRRIDKLSAQGDKARVLQKTIGETMRLRDEWKKAHDSGEKGASALLRRLENNLTSLRKQGVEVGRLAREYKVLGQVARSADLQLKGHKQIDDGRASLKSGIGQAVAATGVAAIPTKVSADYQAMIRDIAIKAGIANAPAEAQMSRTIIQTSERAGMGRNDVADVVNQLVGAGMDLAKALEYAPVAAKFVVGQGSGGTDTAKMIQALQQNAQISDPKQMQQALEAIAYQGQAGSFEASDMAKWFPELLASMGKLGINGMDAVTQLGAMLQVQMKTAGGADEAANNLKNWMEKIGSGDVVKAYDKAGIDYQGSMNTGLQKGMSTLESSFALAQRYIEATDPDKAKQMAEATAKISQEADPAKAQAMINALEQALRTGDIFADMQVKAALTAYVQNKQLYEQLKKDGAQASGILDKNLAERRETSSQKWAEMAQAGNDALRSIGDAIRPATDALAEGLTTAARGVTTLTDKAPPLVIGLAAAGAGFLALRNVVAAIKIGRGLLNVTRGAMAGQPNAVQRVFVTNPTAAGPDVAGEAAKGAGKGGRLARAATVVKATVPLAVLGAGLKAVEVYQTATTQDEKAEGYGNAAGTLAGTMAGAAAGAAVGSVVPLIGTVVGGLIGGMLGAWGGGELGGQAGKAVFGAKAQASPNVLAPSPLLLKPLPGPAMGDVARALMAPESKSGAVPPMMLKPAPAPMPPPAKIEQKLTFAPNLAITVQGDVKDPAQLSRDLEPHLRRLFDDFTRQAESRKLFDAPHVG